MSKTSESVQENRPVPDVQMNPHSCNKVEKIRKGYMETWKETKEQKKKSFKEGQEEKPRHSSNAMRCQRHDRRVVICNRP